MPVAGLYDFGLFVDGAFSLSLIGAGGLAHTVSHDTVAGSSGRDYFTLGGLMILMRCTGGGVKLPTRACHRCSMEPDERGG